MRPLDEEAAFGEYVAMFEGRSYQAIADKWGVSKRRIVDVARRNNWLARLAKIEADARVASDRKMTETRAEMRERHLKMIRAMATRGMQGLQAHTFDNARDSSKAVEASIKLELTVTGAPNQHLAVSIQDISRREIESLIATPDEPDDDDDDWQQDTTP